MHVFWGMKKLVKSIYQVNLFLAYFTHLKPQCAGRQNDCDTVGCVAITAPYSAFTPAPAACLLKIDLYLAKP